MATISVKEKRSSSRRRSRSQRPSKPSVTVKVNPPRNKPQRQRRNIRPQVNQHQLSKVRRRHQNVSKRMPKGRDAFVEMLSMPHLAPTIRVSSGFQAAPTAVAAPFSLVPVDFSAGSGTNKHVPDGASYYAISRSPLTAIVMWIPNSAGENYDYSADFTSPTGIGLVRTLTCAMNESPGTLLSYDLNPQRFAGLSEFQPHGPYYYCVDIGEYKAFHVTAMTGITTQVEIHSDEPLDITSTATGHRWSGTTWLASAPVVQHDANTFILNVGETGYWRFSVTIKSATGVAVNSALTLEYTSTHNVFGIRPLPHFEDVQEATIAVRVSAASLMLTPTAPELYKGGSVTGVQLPDDVDWYEPIESGLSTLSAYNNSVTMDSDKGMYAFIKPTEATTFDLHRPCIYIKDELSGFKNPIPPNAGWLVMTPSCAKIQDSWPGGMFVMTACFAVEFQTTSTWFQSLPPSMEPSHTLHSLQVAARMPQFHTNSFHISDILNFLGGAAKTVFGIAPEIANVVSAVVPEAGPVAQFVGKIVKGIGDVI